MSMDLDRLQSDLQCLAEIVGGWDATKEINTLERDLVLEKLRSLYERVRFGTLVPSAPVEDPMPEAVDPIDLGEVLSLDPLPAEPAGSVSLPDGKVYPVVINVGAAGSETDFSAEPSHAEPSKPVPVSGSVAESAESVSEPDPAVMAENPAPASEPAVAAPDSVPSASGEKPAPDPIVAAVPAEPEPAPESESDAEPESKPDSDPASEQKAGNAETGSEVSGSHAVEAFVSASVAEAVLETTASSEAVPASESDHTKTAARNLFGVEEASSRHRHKQRVIMSLYGSDMPESSAANRMPEPSVGPKHPQTAAPDRGMPSPASDVTEEHPAVEGPTLSETLVSPGAVLGEVINANVHTLADTIAPPHDIASELRRSEPVTDLHRAIGINDKFLMIRDLFDGDGEAFERTIEALNGFDNLDDCMIYVAENYAWNANSDGAKLLMDLLERKFA